MDIKFSQELACFHQPRHLAVIPPKDCRVLCFGAHADDLEIMCGHEAHISSLNGKRDFFGVVVADGAGPKPRAPRFESLTRCEMAKVRIKEQIAAADAGEYGGVFQLVHPSASFCHLMNETLVDEIHSILETCRPETLYAHNPLDAHHTHVAVYYHVCAALQRMPKNHRPKAFFGGEVWGHISRWYVLCNEENQEFAPVKLVDCSRALEFIRRVLGNFASQNEIMGYSQRIPEHHRIRAGLLDPYQSPDVTAVCLLAQMHSLLEDGACPKEYYLLLKKLHDDAMDKRHVGYT
jgi:LmbE family N-acetylglucosaminyl deacetylase